MFGNSHLELKLSGVDPPTRPGRHQDLAATLAVESCSAERPAARWLIWGP